MGFRTTAILLLVAGILALLLVVTGEGPVEPTEITEPVLGGHRVEETSRIVIERADAGQAIVIERESDGTFHMVEPMRDLASVAVLRAVAVSYDTARRLVAYTPAEVAAEPRLLHETGVESPRARVRFEFMDGEVVEAALGERAPLGEDMFALMGDTIYRVGLDLYTVLEVNVDDMREHLVFRQLPAEVAEISAVTALPTGGFTLRIVQEGGQYRMLEPVESRLDGNNLATFIQRIFGMRVERFVAGVARPPKPEPDVVVTLHGIIEERVEYWFQPGELMLGKMENRGVWFSLAGKGGEEFFTTAVDNLRAHLLVPIEAQEIVQLTLDPGSGGQPAVLTRTGEGFRLYSPVEADADPTAVNSIMQGLRNLGVEEFVDGEKSDPEFGLNGGFFTVSVRGRLSTMPILVRLGRDEGAQTYAHRDDEDQVVKVPKAVADLLRQPWHRFVADVVQRVPVPPGELRFVQAGREVAYVRRDGRWVARSGGPPLPLVEEVIDELVDLRAREVLDPDSIQLDVEPYQLQLLRASGDLLTQLWIYDRGDAQPLLVSNGRIDVLFELPVSLSRDLRELR